MKTADDECGKPCDPALENECCSDYWARMKTEGFWTGREWTAKGFKEMTK